MHRFFILMLLCISVFTNGFSQSKSAIIPTPISVLEKDGNFIINNETIVYFVRLVLYRKFHLKQYP